MQPAHSNENIQNLVEHKLFTPLTSRWKIPLITPSTSKSTYNGIYSPTHMPFYTPFLTPLRNSNPLYETPLYEFLCGDGEGSFCFLSFFDVSCCLGDGFRMNTKVLNIRGLLNNWFLCQESVGSLFMFFVVNWWQT